MENDKRVETARKIAEKHANSGRMVMFENVGKFIRWFSTIIDKIFYSPRYAPVFALLIALLAYFVTNYDSSSATITSSKVLSNVSINTRYNSGTFELSGVPQACEIVLTGEAGNVTNAASKKGYCQVDLEGYTEGTHTVKLTAQGYGDSVSAIISPSEVTVTLKKKTTMQFDLSYDYINQNSMDSRYILSEPDFSSSGKINIRASQDTLNSIAMVKALIDVSGATEDFTISAPLVAYDKNGRVVDAELVPSSVEATVHVSSPSKEVPIRLNPVGTIPVGLAIDSITIVNHQTATIYGSEAVLSGISEIYANYDLSTVTEGVDKEIMLPVTLPAGVSSSTVTVVNVKVTLAIVENRELADIPLNVHDNFNNLAVSEIDATTATVIVSGSNTNINAISETDVEVYFTMPEEPGTYTVPLYVTCDSNPYISLSTNPVNVTITVIASNQ
ncbi:MAG: CdaR family protein [Erysipelotrichaceae bacterium]|nr:CdaR family protein [Erysipelotrichaceae bacterium]